MKRRNFMLTALASIPMVVFAKIKTAVNLRANKGFKINAGKARFGTHYKMKGVTQNILDIKISGIDTDNDIAVFEHTGLTPKGGPPLHIHPYQDEWFYIVEGEYLFQVGEDKYELKTGDTIFLPRQVPHAFIQLTEKGKMIVSYLPAGKMEAFFAVTDKWTMPPNRKFQKFLPTTICRLWERRYK